MVSFKFLALLCTVAVSALPSPTDRHDIFERDVSEVSNLATRQNGLQRLRLQYSNTGRFLFVMGVELTRLPAEIMNMIAGAGNDKGPEGKTVSESLLENFLSWAGSHNSGHGTGWVELDSAPQKAGIFAKSAMAADNMAGFGIQLEDISAFGPDYFAEAIQDVVALITGWAGGGVRVDLQPNNDFLPLEQLGAPTKRDALEERARSNTCPPSVNLLPYAAAIPSYTPLSDLAWAGKCDA